MSQIAWMFKKLYNMVKLYFPDIEFISLLKSTWGTVLLYFPLGEQSYQEMQQIVWKSKELATQYGQIILSLTSITFHQSRL